MDKLPYKILIGLVVIGAGIAVIFSIVNRKPKEPIIPAFASQFSTPSPSPSSQNTILAPDGKMSLIVRQQKVADGVNNVISASRQDGSQVQIYSKTEPTGSSLSVPYNTFSPDDKYIFLKEGASSQTYYYVLSTDGKPMANDSQAVEITSLFYAKYSDFKITDMTGWGGLTLIIVNTNNNDGSIGPSFWFDVLSKSFIRLGTRFN